MNIRIGDRINIDLPMDYRTVLLTAGVREPNNNRLKKILERRIVFLYRGIIAFQNSKSDYNNAGVYASNISIDDAIKALEKNYYEKGNEYVVSQLYRAGELNLAPEIYQMYDGIEDSEMERE